ncbi:MAG: ATP-binding protein [Bacteroidia bacterium]
MIQYQAQYQSANLSDEEVINNFVVRTKEFQRVMEDIRSTTSGDSFQHYVFIGRRGSGKSTLLRRIQAEISTTPKFKQDYLVTNLSEEQAGIYKLYDFWDYVIRDLQAQGLEIETPSWLEYEDDMKAYTRVLYGEIQQCLDKVGKRLILLVDNIDRIFKTITAGKGGDTSLLREQLMNYNLVRIIGGSTVMSEDYWRHDMPFYQFFSIKRLEPLTIEEIKNLLNHWGQQKNLPDINAFVKKNPGKLQAIRMLTDGTPRTMLLFVEMLLNRPRQNGYDYMRKIIDHATPVYQERLLQLSQQQQKILLELSFFWEAAPIEKLIEVCKMPGKTVSAQLSQLVKSRIVEKVQTGSKNLLYRLEERFFNLWLLMTQGGPRQKREVKYLTEFVENWYDQDEIKHVYREFMNTLKTRTVKGDYAASMTKASIHNKQISLKEREELLARAQDLNLNADWLQELPASFLKILERCNALAVEGKWQEMENLLLSVEQDGTHKFTALGEAHMQQDKFEEAETMYLKAVKRKHPHSMYILANHYYSKNIKGDKAIKLISNAIRNLPESVLFDYKENLILLWQGSMEAFRKNHDLILTKLLDDNIRLLQDYTTELLVHNQYNLLKAHFEQGEFMVQLKDQISPVYYALLKLMGGNQPNLLKMPPEIAENVDDIVKYVKERQKVYYG